MFVNKTQPTEITYFDHVTSWLPIKFIVNVINIPAKMIIAAISKKTFLLWFRVNF